MDPLAAFGLGIIIGIAIPCSILVVLKVLGILEVQE